MLTILGLKRKDNITIPYFLQKHYLHLCRPSREKLCFSVNFKLIDLDTDNPLTYDDLYDEDGCVSIRFMGGNYNVNLAGGNEGTVTINNNTTRKFYRSKGKCVLTINHNEEKKYEVTSENAYIIWSGDLICYRTSILVQIYVETTIRSTK